MIIWGSRGLDLKGPPGRFFCPQCNDERDYERRKVQRFFTLYFIPIIPLDVVHESIGCRTCRQHFTLAVLQYDPRAERAQMDQELNAYYQTVIGQFGRLCGRQDEALNRRIVGAMAAFDGSVLSPEDAQAVLGRTDRNYGVAMRNLAMHLKDRGREIVVKSALEVATTDGVLDEPKVAAITELATAVGMSDTHLRGVLAEWTPTEAGA